jgi:hypothetical protein
MAMMESLMIGVALWLATQRKRTSRAPYRNRRDSLTRMPGTYGLPAEWSWGDDRDYRDGFRDAFQVVQPALSLHPLTWQGDRRSISLTIR